MRRYCFSPILRLVAAVCAVSWQAAAEVSVTGKVVDENGAAVAGAQVELRLGEGPAAGANTDVAGNFNLTLPAAGDYRIRTQRQGFFLFTGGPQLFEEGTNLLTVTLNHLQEFTESIDVTYSPPAIDLQEPAERKQLDNVEMMTVPYPAPQDFRNALPLMDGVIQDNAGRLHVNGGATEQTSFTLDGFNLADPVTGRLEARLNIESVRSMDLDSSRYSADKGRGAAGALDVQTKTGDDRWRFGGTNFVPGVSSESGFHISKWTPRLEVSGPIARGRAWIHNGFDAFYDVNTVHGLPRGENRTRGRSGSDLTRFQVNVTPANILTGSFLVNYADRTRYGLSFLSPAETTTSQRQDLYMSTIRDQIYFGNGALVDVGFADTRGSIRDEPQGNLLYQITPEGNRGNYFVSMDRHSYRQQWQANLFWPVLHAKGTHHVTFGIDFERESFHGKTMRHDYEVLREDGSVARLVQFSGGPFQTRKNFEAAQFVQDQWTVRDGLSVEAGLRVEWNEIVRDLAVAPRMAVVWAPRGLRGAKIAAGYGVYYDSVSLGTIARAQDQVSMATFFTPAGAPVRGPVTSAFRVNEQVLESPRSQNVSVSVERKLPFEFYGRAGYMRRRGERGFAFVPAAPGSPDAMVYDLRSTRLDWYAAFDASVRRTFAGQYEWFAGYTRSRARSNSAVEYSLENPIYAAQAPGPYAWDSPHRFHMWGWAPVPKRLLPAGLGFLIRNTTAAYLLEYRTGFPFGVVSEEGFLVGRPNSRRYPGYFNLNLHFERKFRALHYLWAWRFGFTNLTNNGNPNWVNNVLESPTFLVYGRGQARAFSVRLRLLGKK